MSVPVRGARRRVLAVVLVLALLAVAALVAVILSLQGDARPSAGPPPVTSPSAASSMTPPPTTAPATTPPSSSLPPTVPPSTAETETPEAGQTPVTPPVTVPPPPIGTPTVTPPPFPSALRGEDITVIPGAGRVVALTFDAGANSAGLPKILSALATKGVTATFFLTGNWATNNPGGVRQITAAGHRVANHSMTHPGFTGLSASLIAQQVLGAEHVIRAAGADPRPLFRFPYGERDARTIAAVNGLGYVAVRWTVDTLGWKGISGGITSRVVADRVMAALQPGEIVLMHIGSNPDDGSTLDADALPRVIDLIRAAGYGFTTLDALVGP